jgi:hypothetical protein
VSRPVFEIFLTREEAIAHADSGWWVGRTAVEIVAVQGYCGRCIMPFGDFQSAAEEAVGSPLWTHQFSSSGWGLVQEAFERLHPDVDRAEIQRMLLTDERGESTCPQVGAS